MLLHEFGKDFVLALEFLFEVFDLTFLGGLDRFGGAAVVEGEVAVLEELLLPAIEEGRGDAEFIAERGDGRFFEEVPFKDGDLLLGRKMTTLRVHDKPPYR